MEDKIKELEEYLAWLESEYEIALQNKDEKYIAYKEGKIDGVKYVLSVLREEGE